MNSLLWIAQILLAGVFLFAGFRKIFAIGRPELVPATVSGIGYIGLPHEVAAAVALVEIAGAICLLVPVDIWPPDGLLRLAASALALLALVACVYHARRKEHTAPIIAVFLLALFVIVGRWPR